MTQVDRKTLTRARATNGAGAHPQREPAPTTRDNGVAPSGPQRPAPPIAKQAPNTQPEVAGKMGQPAPEREPLSFGWLVLIGAIFGLAVVKELHARIGRPVVVTAKSVPHPPRFWTAVIAGTLARIGARVLGLRSAL